MNLKNSHLIVILLFFLAGLYAYYPGFSIVFNGADAAKYFLETKQASSWDLLTKYLSYPRGTQYYVGDTLVFKPLASIHLGLQKIAFETLYSYWRIYTLLLHILVTLLLYRILISIDQNIFAMLFCLLFSVWGMFTALMILEHLNFYILFIAFVLAALYNLYLYSIRPEEEKYRFFLILIFMLPACFLSETGVIFSVLFTVFIYINKRGTQYNNKYRPLLILIPALIYLTANIFVKIFTYSWHMEFEASKIVNIRNFLDSIVFTPTIIFKWIGYGFFIRPTSSYASSFLPMWLRYAALILFFSYFVLGSSLNQLKKNFKMILLLISMIISYVWLYCFARIGTHDISYVTSVVHPTYTFWALLIILIYLSMDFGKLKNTRFLRSAGIAGLSIFFALNLIMTHRYISHVANDNKPERQFTDAINDFIKTHKNENDFSFAFLEYSVHDRQITMFKGILDPKNIIKIGQNQEFYYSEIFFSKYYNKDNPSYILRYDTKNDKLLVTKIR